MVVSRVGCCDVVDVFEVFYSTIECSEARSAVVAGETEVASVEVD